MAFQANAFQNDHFVGALVKGFQVVTVPVTVPPSGGGGFVATFTRRRWREFMAAYDAEMAALADMRGNRKPKQQEKLQDAIAATNKAILAAHDQAETAKLSENLQRLANALNAAVGASRVTASIKHANQAITIGNAIAQAIHEQQQEEEDMQMILLLLN